jgi:hypothetical protein
MSKVLTFMQHLPKSKGFNGEPTNFIAKIWKSIVFLNCKYQPASERIPQPKHLLLFPSQYELLSQYLISHHVFDIGEELYCKNHTIRAGNRWEEGDYASLRIWSGKPYNSKQIEFTQEVLIEKVYDFKIRNNKVYVNGKQFKNRKLLNLVRNDGLTLEQFWKFFDKDFTGQIICWNDPKY